MADPVSDGATFDEMVEAAAEAAHVAYEAAAPIYSYETRKESRVSWADLPDKHRTLMRYSIRSALTAAGVPDLLAAHQADRALIEAKDAEMEKVHSADKVIRILRDNIVAYSKTLYEVRQTVDTLTADAQQLQMLIEAKDAEIERLEAENRQWYEAAVEASPESVTTKHMSHWQSGCNCLGDSAICCVESCECHVVPDSPATEAEVLAEDLARVHSLAKLDWATERPCRLADCRIVGEHWHVCPSCLAHLKRSGKGFD